MRSFVRTGWLALSALVFSGLGLAFAQAPPATKAATPPPASKDADDLKQVLATVNGEPITKGELVSFFNRYPLPPSEPEQIYRDAMESLVNTHLIFQFLDSKKIRADEKKVDEMIANMDKKLKENGSSIAAEMLRNGTSMANVRKDCAEMIRWVDYLDSKATDPELQKFFDSHKDLFNGTQLHVLHILLSVDPQASPDEKAKVLARIKAIKDDIDKKKMTFSEAANKFSDDKVNPDGVGGDVGYVSRTNGFVQEFTDAAFAAKVGVVSEPFETPYGYHILLVTERKDGPKVEMEQIKPTVKQRFGQELQNSILTAERAKAKIDIKPMPPGLLGPAVAPTAPAPTPPPAETKKKAATGTAK
jgi:peptidyl-prolyl cis-trans isomerase C